MIYKACFLAPLIFPKKSQMGCQAPSSGSIIRAHQPCAACRMLRRRCDSNCLLAPYFPSEEIDTFAGVHKVFGASNVIKMIQMVEESRREDAVKAVVYEAKARLRDPVYGSAGAIFHLQKMVQELAAELEATRSRLSELREQRDELLGILFNTCHHGFLSAGNQDSSGNVGGGFVSLDNESGMGYNDPPTNFALDNDEWIL